MAKEIGPRERALQEMRERRFGHLQARDVKPAKAVVEELRERVSKIEPKPAKARKAKKGRKK